MSCALNWVDLPILKSSAFNSLLTVSDPFSYEVYQLITDSKRWQLLALIDNEHPNDSTPDFDPLLTLFVVLN